MFAVSDVPTVFRPIYFITYMYEGRAAEIVTCVDIVKCTYNEMENETISRQGRSARAEIGAMLMFHHQFNVNIHINTRSAFILL